MSPPTSLTSNHDLLVKGRTQITVALSPTGSKPHWSEKSRFLLTSYPEALIWLTLSVDMRSTMMAFRIDPVCRACHIVERAIE